MGGKPKNFEYFQTFNRYWLGKKNLKIRTGRDKKCLFCKKEFYVPGWQMETRKYCSSTCYGETLKNLGMESRFPDQSKEKHWNWQGGRSKEAESIRKSTRYKKWRKAVFERDKYTCVFCGQVGRKLNADHIKPFSDFSELRFELSNGRTLCFECHKKTPTWGGSTKFKVGHAPLNRVKAKHWSTNVDSKNDEHSYAQS
jgi:hypothetical protein